MRNALFILAALLCVTTAASAQTQSPATYTLKVYNQGASTPFQTTSAPASAATCNQTVTTGTSGTMVNPTGVAWTDPVNSGKECRLDFTAFFGGLPTGITDTATLSVTDTLGLTSSESNQTGPFVRANPLPGLVSVRVIGGK